MTYFHSQIDTFRWKGENVATTQIAGVLGGVLTAAQEPNVYGVLVPSNDGRAGCAAIPGGILTSIELDSLANHVIKELPNYARPLFLRFVESNSANGTNKQLKVQLRNEGVGEFEKIFFDVSLFSFLPIFFLNLMDFFRSKCS